MAKKKPHQLTEDEVRDELFKHFAGMVDFWLNESRAPGTREKMEGLVFSILAALDGSSLGLPGFIVAPLPHKDDKPYHQNKNENWFPENHKSKVNCDLGGTLHDYWNRYCKAEPGSGE